MIYDLSNPIDKENAITRFKYLLGKKAKVELTQKHPKRTLAQNRYEHLLFGALAMYTGLTMQEVKQEIFKKIVNPDLFYKGTVYVGDVSIEIWRSTADLDKEEKTLAINRLLDYSPKEIGYRLPQPDDLPYLEEIEKELSKQSNKQYL